MGYLTKFKNINSILYKVYFLILTITCILPFLALSFYSHPAADDYVFSSLYKQIGWLKFQKYFYLNWQGLYTTNSIMCSPLNPVLHYRFDLFWITCWFGLGSMICSVWLLMRYLTQHKLATLTLTCTIIILYLYQVPSPTEALFWLNANFAYQMSISLGALLLLVVMRAFQFERVNRAYWTVAVLLTVLLIGTNFIASMLTAFGLGVATLLNLRNKTTRFWWIGLLIMASIAFVVVVLAPGNTVRLSAAMNNSAHILPASGNSKLVYSITHGIGLLIYTLINWLGNGVILAFSILLVPILVSVDAAAPIRIFFKHRFILLIVGATMVSLPFFTTYLAQGGPPASRVINVTYAVFLFFWIFLLYAAVAWRHSKALTIAPQSRYISLAMAAFLIFALSTDANYTLTYRNRGLDSNNIALAYRDWLGGKARQFDQQQQQRYQIMLAPGHTGVVLDSLSVRPQTIFLGDLSQDSTHWANKAYANFFGKAHVRLSKPSESGK